MIITLLSLIYVFHFVLLLPTRYQHRPLHYRLGTAFRSLRTICRASKLLLWRGRREIQSGARSSRRPFAECRNISVCYNNSACKTQLCVLCDSVNLSSQRLGLGEPGAQCPTRIFSFLIILSFSRSLCGVCEHSDNFVRTNLFV